MRKYSMETAVGLFVLAGLICAGYLTIKLGKLEVLGGQTYLVTAIFTDITGLKPMADVQMAGVRIGQVASIDLSADDKAQVTLKINRAVTLNDDSIASIKTSGLIGDKYVKISPGGSGHPIAPGGRLTDTEPSVDLGDLIGKYVFGGVK